jgi:hypothetical protein
MLAVCKKVNVFCVNDPCPTKIGCCYRSKTIPPFHVRLYGISRGTYYRIMFLNYLYFEGTNQNYLCRFVYCFGTLSLLYCVAPSSPASDGAITVYATFIHRGFVAGASDAHVVTGTTQWFPMDPFRRNSTLTFSSCAVQTTCARTDVEWRWRTNNVWRHRERPPRRRHRYVGHRALPLV